MRPLQALEPPAGAVDSECSSHVVADIFSGIQILISGCLFEGNRGPGILSSGALGLTISSNYFVSDYCCAPLLVCLRC